MVERRCKRLRSDRPLVLGALYNGQGEAGIAPTPGGEGARESSTDVYTQASDHPAWRLAQLVKPIRDEDPTCPVTILCHSLGNMVTLALAFLGATLGSDYVASINRDIANSCDGVTHFQMAETQDHGKGLDRDNCGKVFLYCNPHDQVIGVTPVQGIGWKGVDAKQFAKVAGEGVLHVRVWAQPGGNQPSPFKVGCPGWKSYRYVEHNHNPHGFWHPKPPSMRFRLSLNEDQSALSRIFTIATAPVVWLVTHLFDISINDDPPKTWEVPINAPVLREPIMPASRRFGMEGPFDQGKDPAADALAKDVDDSKRDEASQGSPYQKTGLGNPDSEAQLRYEHNARLRAARARQEVATQEDERQAVKRMLEENPNATDHSTILTNPVHAEKVLAYDVAVGWVNRTRITENDLFEFRKFAHWMCLKEAMLDNDLFRDYWAKGWFNGHQLQRTYTMEHMTANAPGIIDERERSLFGYIK